MKYLFINTVPDFGSTGKIVFDTAKKITDNGEEALIAYGRGTPSHLENVEYLKIGNKLSVYLHMIKARLFDRSGFGSYFATRKFLKIAEKYNPDILWLHNLHGYYINIKLLFKWIKRHPDLKVKWTLHDCWSFTGHCAHFTYVCCDKWQKCCEKCPQSNRYPKSIFIDNSKKNYKDKKNIFTGVKDITIQPVSYWLESLVKKSFLKEYNCKVVYNSVDKNVFKYTKSNFKKKYNLENKKLILGVASAWNDRKGLYDFYELSKLLTDDYRIVLVGLNDKQLKSCPKGILALPKIQDQSELAKIYSACDLFLNLSKEETFGLTTIEALSCGTYSIVYKETACEEIVNQFGGEAVNQDIETVKNAVTEYLDKRDI